MQVTEYTICTREQMLLDSVVVVNREGVIPQVDEKGRLINLDNTLADPKMGPVLNMRCATCGDACIGHFGIIDLNGYVIQMTFANYLKQRLKSICTVCKNVVDGSPCINGGRCKTFNTIKNSKDGTFEIDKTKWTAKHIYDFLATVNPDVWVKRNLPNPIHMIATHIYVLPNPDRVYVKHNGNISAHVFTSLYNQLLMTIEKQKKRMDHSDDNSELYLAYNNVFYATKAAWGEHVHAKGIAKSIDKKEGCMRKNMLAKRVNYCGRGVIRCSYKLRFDEIRIPQHMAKKLTTPVFFPRPEMFTAREQLRKIVENGQWASIVCKNGVKFDSDGPKSHRLIAAQLDTGDQINRWLKDGDSTLFLRQPTLHKGSLMRFTVKLQEDPADPTISLHMLSTTPFNADCDGDEMNLFIPQTLNGIADVDELMDVKNCVLNENGHVQIYPIQNDMLGMFEMTTMNPNALVPKHCFFKKPRFGNKPYYTVMEFMSNPLPTDFSCKGVSNGMITTPLNKSIMKNMILELNQISSELVADVLYEMCTQANEWICERGASMEFKDFLVSHPFEFKNSTDFPQKFAQAQTYIQNHCNKNSSMYKIISSGTKGSFNDFLSVSMVVGQQYVANKPPIAYMGDRMFPFQEKGDHRSDIARGIITNSYVQGLTPEQMAVHATSAKHGIIVKAVNIKECGARFRKLSQVLESFVVGYTNCMVKDTEQNIVQFKYGEDGLDPKCSKLLIRTKGVSVPLFQDKLRQYVDEHIREDSIRRRLCEIPVSTDDEVAYVIRRYEKSLVEPGHAVGLNAAHCISEPATQARLDAIHSAGSGSTSNAQRINELFNGSDLKHKGQCTMKVVSTNGMQRIELKSWRVTQQKLKLTEWMRRFSKVFSYEQKRYTLVMVFYPGKSTRDIVLEVNHLNVCASHHIHDGLEVTVHVSSDDATELHNIVTRLSQNSEVIKQYTIKDETTITCVSSLNHVFTSFPDVDHRHTTSTCLDDMRCTLGVEAARTMLLRELREIDNFSDGIDIRHLLMMVDAMTYKGMIHKMDFHGLKHNDPSVLGKAAFEDPLYQLSSAAANGVKQNTSNLSECVISGRLCPVGSGYNQFELIETEAPANTFYDPTDDILFDIQMPLRPFLPSDASAAAPAVRKEEYDPLDDYTPADEGVMYRPSSPYLGDTNVTHSVAVSNDPPCKRVKIQAA